MNRVLENLYLDLNDAIPYCLRCLADYYEEQGNIRMRNAWLYIAKERFEPLRQRDGEYRWYIGNKNSTDYLLFSHDIPAKIIKYHKGDVLSDQLLFFKTPTEAYQWLVELVVQWQDNEK